MTSTLHPNFSSKKNPFQRNKSMYKRKHTERLGHAGLFASLDHQSHVVSYNLPKEGEPKVVEQEQDNGGGAEEDAGVREAVKASQRLGG